ncbi:phosphoribosylpyrophosphate synthetase [Sphingobacterium hotanense]|uniref:phosphoribosylpyrophosphate synthetase n=1 Tax=Sphingobacterium hotanense TaxID=649196 RepID=UPI0021A3EBE2|nr:phosphoribosylpyrophosphate synthetase [Sphingobacterium hotanense]MCT1525763.1 phosphoribosylpyrophosphate synthetase [Sphingobacterium hotanense]
MALQNKRSYDTLSEAVNDLQAIGYTEDFLIREDGECLYCAQNAMELSPEEFVIDGIYRFEGMTDPADESILFAISSRDNLIRGLVINSFGAEFSYRSSKLVEELYRRSREVR